ncbi:hypothetical protein DPMN_186152 [Dreissena polymorpha]|uniref:Uncharacterized protein n=1 Tax=Dreissena polymorpha TaxID=45954 RepID=A0A9D4I7Y2_DREPO|nr:hypothetical protein DPMN_186152 [Dreissena polymorpha]
MIMEPLYTAMKLMSGLSKSLRVGTLWKKGGERVTVAVGEDEKDPPHLEDNVWRTHRDDHSDV